VIMAAVILPLYRKMTEVRVPPAQYYERVQRGNVTVLEYANLRQEAIPARSLADFSRRLASAF